MKFDKDLLKTIVCPQSKERLIYDEKRNCLIAKTSKACLSNKKWNSYNVNRRS